MKLTSGEEGLSTTSYSLGKGHPLPTWSSMNRANREVLVRGREEVRWVSLARECGVLPKALALETELGNLLGD